MSLPPASLQSAAVVQDVDNVPVFEFQGALNPWNVVLEGVSVLPLQPALRQAQDGALRHFPLWGLQNVALRYSHWSGDGAAVWGESSAELRGTFLRFASTDL